MSKSIKTGYYWQDVGTVYKNEKGQLHREDGPAVELGNGAKEWYMNGNLHREDGPATIGACGWKEWFINGYFVYIY